MPTGAKPRPAFLRGSTFTTRSAFIGRGLAGLDAWDATRAALVSQARNYAVALARSSRARLQQGFGANWVANTCMVELPAGTATTVGAQLAEAGIETRAWWGDGAHRQHTVSKNLPRGHLPRTEHPVGASIRLPFYADVTLEQIEEVVDMMLTALRN